MTNMTLAKWRLLKNLGHNFRRVALLCIPILWSYRVERCALACLSHIVKLRKPEERPKISRSFVIGKSFENKAHFSTRISFEFFNEFYVRNPSTLFFSVLGTTLNHIVYHDRGKYRVLIWWSVLFEMWNPFTQWWKYYDLQDILIQYETKQFPCWCQFVVYHKIRWCSCWHLDHAEKCWIPSKNNILKRMIEIFMNYMRQQQLYKRQWYFARLWRMFVTGNSQEFSTMND